MNAPCRPSRVVVLAIVVAGGITTPALAQPPIVNAHIERRSVAGRLEADVQAIAARGTPLWIAYRVPMIAERYLGSPDVALDGHCCVCRLEGGAGVILTDREPRGLRLTVEPPTELLVFARAESGRIVRLRTLTPDCEIDGGGVPLIWLDGVGADDSVAWLTSLARSSAGDKSSRADDRIARSALIAIALHSTGTAAPQLIELARTRESPKIRRQAMIALGLSKDPRAFTFFEEILKR